jgi:flagellar basal-body rod protein FlgF
MSGGAYSALSGMRARLEELDRLAFDLANVSTSGYKTERAAKTAVERNEFATALEAAVDVMSSGTKIDFTSGAIANTGRDLDVAIDGRGFFEIETARGLRYTRNGGFQRRNDGLLATADGEPVMGEGGPITLGTGAVSVSGDGTVKSGNAIVGRIRVVEFESERDLIRESGSRFRALTGAEPADAEAPKVIGGALEQSNVSIVDRMASLTELSRGFEALQKGVSVLMNDLDSRVISELGRK